MKRDFLTAAAVVLSAASAVAQETAPDTVITAEQLQEVVVSGVRAPKNAPFAVANIKKQQLSEFSTTGRELPFLFSQTPGVVAWGENGLGTGTSLESSRGLLKERGWGSAFCATSSATACFCS